MDSRRAFPLRPLGRPAIPDVLMVLPKGASPQEDVPVQRAARRTLAGSWLPKALGLLYPPARCLVNVFFTRRRAAAFACSFPF